MRPDIDSLDHRSERALRSLARTFGPALDRYFRPVVRGIERVPVGPVLFVGNHNSSLLSPDSFIAGCALHDRYGVDAVPYGLAHTTAISAPIFGDVLRALGAVRACHENAGRLFERGRNVLVYPGGDLESNRPTRRRDQIVFGGRMGYIRLALRHGVPIAPIVAAGAHSTYFVLTDGRRIARLLRVDRTLRLKSVPIVWSLPWGWTLGPPPPHFPLPTRIYIEFLDPIAFEPSGEEASSDSRYVEACHDRVTSAMQDALTRLAAERRRDRRDRVRRLLSAARLG